MSQHMKIRARLLLVCLILWVQCSCTSISVKVLLELRKCLRDVTGLCTGWENESCASHSFSALNPLYEHCGMLRMKSGEKSHILVSEQRQTQKGSGIWHGHCCSLNNKHQWFCTIQRELGLAGALPLSAGSVVLYLDYWLSTWKGDDTPADS